MKFIEITPDNGYRMTCLASDNNATYVLTSAYAHDLYTGYMERYNFVYL